MNRKFLKCVFPGRGGGGLWNLCYLERSRCLGSICWLSLFSFQISWAQCTTPHFLRKQAAQRSQPCSGKWRWFTHLTVCCFINDFFVPPNEPVLTFAQNQRTCWNKSPDWVAGENQACFPLTRKSAWALGLSLLSAEFVCGTQSEAVKEKRDLIF